MNTGERNYAFVTIGAGDTFEAIGQLLKLIAAKGVPVRPHLVLLCAAWLDTYALHEDYENLRGALDRFVMADTNCAASAPPQPQIAPNHQHLQKTTSTLQRPLPGVGMAWRRRRGLISHRSTNCR